MYVIRTILVSYIVHITTVPRLSAATEAGCKCDNKLASCVGREKPKTCKRQNRSTTVA